MKKPNGRTKKMAAEKPGYLTTEFYLSLLAMLLSALFAAGVLADGSTFAKVGGVLGTVLSGLGYTVTRSSLKKAPPK